MWTLMHVIKYYVFGQSKVKWVINVNLILFHWMLDT